jgi:hypothetical protein
MDSGTAKGATYRIVVRGELDSRFACLFNDMQMTQVDGTTTLTGQVIDQAQLHGYLERFEELGLELLAVEQMGDTLTSGRKGTE